MNKRPQNVPDTSLSELSANATSLQLLFPENPPAPDIDRHALAAAPLCCWMLDALAPGRVLTVGAASEMLHLVLCQSVADQAAETVCVHLAPDFSRAFLDARTGYGAVRSQLLTVNPSAPRLGAEGQFDLIVLSLTAPPDPALAHSWRNGLCQDGVLAVRWTGGDALEGAADAAWRVGDERLALFWGADAPEVVKTLAAIEAPADAHRTLGDVLAAFVALLATRQGRQAQMNAEAQVSALRERHRSDLVLLTRRLAEMEEQAIAQRTELKAAKAALEMAASPRGADTDAPDESGPQT